MPDVAIVNALSTGRLAVARDITFEYLALTQGEARLPVPQDIHALPEPLRSMTDSLAELHAPPGALLLALDGDTVCGTVALQRSSLTTATDAVVQRLYVRAAFRRRGIARQLMATVQAIAAAEGFDRLVLNVMATRRGALTFYETLGFTPIAEPVDWPYGGIWLARDIGP